MRKLRSWRPSSDDEEASRKASTAVGEAAVTLNPDNSLTYSAATAGFETKFLGADVHEGPARAVGSTLFGLVCNSDGTSCSGKSPPLGATEKASVTAGNTYVNFRTEASSDGEIRGQLVPVTLVPGMEDLAAEKFRGRVTHVGRLTASGSARRGQVRMSGRFSVSGDLDLAVSSVVVQDLLNEMGGAGELLRGKGGEPALPIPLRLTSYRSRRGPARYKAIGAGLHPSCRLKIRSRSRQVFEFSLRCKGAEVPTIPAPPQLCSEGPRPTTNLMTSFVINAVKPVMVKTVKPWRCLGTQVRFRETGAADGSKKPRRMGSAKVCGAGGNRAPVAAFRADPRRGESPLSVTMTNRSVDPDGDVVGFRWDFGDGSGSTDENPTHIYTRPGQFIVTLMAKDSQGMTSKLKRENISVKESRRPRADFLATPRMGNPPLTVTFTNLSSDPDGDLVAFEWTFGDGSSSIEENPTHVYREAGDFVVALTVTDDRGVSSEPKRENIGVKGNQSPRADFLATPRMGNPPLTVTFTNLSSDPDGDLVAFGWTFGDGSGSIEENPTHTYREAGDFVVALTVTDDRGRASGVKRDTVSVRHGQGTEEGVQPGRETAPDPVENNRPPRADFRMSQDAGAWPLTVAFTDNSWDPDGDRLAFRWTFGDGRGGLSAVSTEENPTYTYTSAGVFGVTLIVTDQHGMASAPKRETISVVMNRPPRADFRPAAERVCTSKSRVHE